ncbi:MAG: anaerobic ribonucleoside-triphosphate reductase [Bacilli bacterium]|nr:anaerobic ribonucleoside-triphosphate reductase [Bacilli bacterium]
MKTEEKEVKTIGEGIGFERIRRITGYLVGTVDRFNNGKRAEEHDRVKHGTEGILEEAK